MDLDDASMSDETFTPGHTQASVVNADTRVETNNQAPPCAPQVSETICTNSTAPHRRPHSDSDDDASMSDETFTPGHTQASVDEDIESVTALFTGTGLRPESNTNTGKKQANKTQPRGRIIERQKHFRNERAGDSQASDQHTVTSSSAHTGEQTNTLTSHGNPQAHVRRVVRAIGCDDLEHSKCVPQHTPVKKKRSRNSLTKESNDISSKKRKVTPGVDDSSWEFLPLQTVTAGDLGDDVVASVQHLVGIAWPAVSVCALQLSLMTYGNFVNAFDLEPLMGCYFRSTKDLAEKFRQLGDRISIASDPVFGFIATQEFAERTELIKSKYMKKSKGYYIDFNSCYKDKLDVPTSWTLPDGEKITVPVLHQFKQ